LWRCRFLWEITPNNIISWSILFSSKS
jgi:hypothetical protein